MNRRDSFCIGICVGVILCALAMLISAIIDQTFVKEPAASEQAQIIFDTQEPEEEPAALDTNYPDESIVNGISQEERDLIERVVAAEARGESYLGMIAVCQCIKDRGDAWGMTYTEVVLQEGQFADPYGGTVPDLVELAVHECFDLGYRASESPIYHFYAQEKVTPEWASEKVLVMVEGGHTFMY